MPGIRETRRLPYSAEQMFDLVADVGRYGEFLPWVIATRVRSNTETEMIADMVVGFKAIRESFTSRVTKQRASEIAVHYVDGPLSDLDNVWTFRVVDDRTCEIDFLVDFTFKNRLFERIAGQYFDRAFRKMVEAFEMRAAQLYGNSSSSAQSVA
ncbi:MAG: type II toxin-antitoxin system RatA family toxin [Sphingomonadales bacterium]|nr:type II toxin-antitoxin system RatA family toxin [Sphingomonadales bacterium]NCQ20904.1 type II toxin-antitoxin system RatA family toxin [Sphingomonadales bacterium]NCT02661.1 type II toxin-antitoxin system RatA family toxin [Sphingomonadales bacterium]